MTALPDVPPVERADLYQFLQALRQRMLSATSTTASTSGSGVLGVRQPPSFTLDFGAVGDGASSNDTQFQAAEASEYQTVRIPEGTFVTSLAKSALTKAYTGDGIILAGTDALPADFSYMARKPTTWPVQGQAGWFRGDQRFTDGGEWKIIGPSVRTYDPLARYFESTCIPHHAWLDIESGSSGAQAYLTSGAAAGAATVTINGAASAEWVGKQVNICRQFGGAAVETKTVQSVSGNSVTFSTPLANSYTWNPSSGLSPCLSFAPRTWNGHKYIRVRHRGGGDGYGHIVRLNVEYQPKPSELAHTFMAATGGQYGGDINFIAGSTGTYATGWESMYTDQGNDVAVIARVDSFNRSNDKADGGGRMWLGTYLKSEGARPSDAAEVIGGKWRYAFDTARASLVESTYLLDPVVAGSNAIRVKSVNGALIGDTVTISNGGSFYSGSVTGIAGDILAVSPSISSAFPAAAYVEFPNGGSIINAALGQRVIWNSTANNNGRSGDPLGVFGPLYGNVQGDIETGTSNDGSGDYWFTRFNGRGHSGANARIRLRPSSFQVNVDIQCGATINASRELVSSGLTGVGNVSGAVIFGAGLGHQIRFNTATNKFEFWIAGTLTQTIP